MKHTRCEEVVVQLVVRTYDDMNRPVGEKVTQQVKVFRNAETLDFWAHVDKAVKAMEQPAEPPAPAKPETRKKR